MKFKYLKKYFIPLCFCIFFNVSAVYSQTGEDDPIRVETNLVVVPVRVLDAKNEFVPNLKKENFTIFEDKTRQEIAQFGTDETPFTVALMLDASDSAKFKLPEIQKAAAVFLSLLRPQDQALVFTFDSNLINIYQGSGEKLEKLESSLQLIRRGGGTSLYDAVDTVINQYLNKASDRKKAIVLFTDGIDTTSTANFSDSLRIAEESSALIYSIQYDTVSDNQKKADKNPFGAPSVTVVTSKGEPLTVAYKRGTFYLNQLSEKSGGKSFFADSVSNLENVFSRIANELRQQYILGYYPSNQDEKKQTHNLKIKTDVPATKTIARRSYKLKSSNK